MVLPSCRGSRNDQSFCVLMSFGMRTLFISSEVTHMPNAKVLESKKAIVDALAEKLQNSTSAVFVDYKGITVAQDTELRRKFREAGVEYTVVKNTLTRFAANKAGYNQFDELLTGNLADRCLMDQVRVNMVCCQFRYRAHAGGVHDDPVTFAVSLTFTVSYNAAAEKLRGMITSHGSRHKIHIGAVPVHIHDKVRLRMLFPVRHDLFFDDKGSLLSQLCLRHAQG